MAKAGDRIEDFKDAVNRGALSLGFNVAKRAALMASFIIHKPRERSDFTKAALKTFPICFLGFLLPDLARMHHYRKKLIASQCSLQNLIMLPKYSKVLYSIYKTFDPYTVTVIHKPLNSLFLPQCPCAFYYLCSVTGLAAPAITAEFRALVMGTTISVIGAGVFAAVAVLKVGVAGFVSATD